MNIGILIPCYNEEKTIETTVSQFKSFLPNAVICVCDNNSTDNTLKVAVEAGAEVITENRQGKGYAMQTLFNYAKYKKFDIVIMVDGDDTYSASNAIQLINEIENGYDMVIGNRVSYFEENKKFINGFGNKVVKTITKLFFSKDILDPLSGYRAFSKNFIDKYPCDVSGFDIEVDMNSWASKNRMRIKSIPIDYKDRIEGSYSKINWRDGIKILWRMLKN